MQYFYHLQYHTDKYKFKNVRDLLLNTRNIVKKKKSKQNFGGVLSMYNSFEKSFHFVTIFKAYEKVLKKNKSEVSRYLSDSNNKSDYKNISRNIRLSQMKKSRFIYINGFYTSKKRLNKSTSDNIKLNNEKEKMSKSLLFKKFPSLEDEIFNLDRKYKHSDIIKHNINSVDKKIIKIPKDINNIDFRKNINLRMKILKNNEQNKILKKNILKKIYIRLGDKVYNKIKNMMEQREFNVEVKNNKDPFKRNQNEYKKNMKKLQKKYGFYPYNYLEEHKNIDPDTFKFMVDNFNTKFSLFGKEKIVNDGYKNNHKKIFFSKNEKPIERFLKRIKRIESKEKMYKI